MAGTMINRVRLAAAILACVGLVLVAAAPLQAQILSPARETPSDTLARNIRTLASSPRDFTALIGAGKAALALGDTQSAVGFFGRAEEVWPSSPMPQIGMGAALALSGSPAEALTYFNRAQQLGATAISLGLDRGLAYDLLGRNREAQADYRAALAGPEGDEARRRLALSLAISGDRTGALAILAPLMAKGDAAAARVRALVLALTGDAEGAKRSMATAMPSSSAAIMDPFFRQLPQLRADQKAAAVHLGIFPDAPGSALASGPATSPVKGDRLASIEELLSGKATSQPAAPPPATPAQPGPAPQQPTQLASVNLNAAAPSLSTKRFWVQLASGKNASALPGEFKRIKARHERILEGINGYIAEAPDRYRLVVGPFKTSEDASIFAEALASERVDAFSWTKPPGQTIRKLPSE